MKTDKYTLAVKERITMGDRRKKVPMALVPEHLLLIITQIFTGRTLPVANERRRVFKGIYLLFRDVYITSSWQIRRVFIIFSENTGLLIIILKLKNQSII